MMHVLLAQDDIASRQALEAMLTQWGYQVVVAQDGSDALRILEGEKPPKLAILDRVMPGMDGIAVCREVRKRLGMPYVYIIILTTQASQADVIEGLNAGADEYLVQPLDNHQLKAHLNAAQRILDLQDQLIGAREALRDQAMRDSLTSLWNHGAIIDILKRELERSQRTGAAVGVIMADLDHFKQINDTHGHRAGDEVLCQAARRLESILRPYDSIGRYGGEEFLIVLPGCDTSSTAALAERLRRAIGGKAVLLPEGPVPVTSTLGVSSNWDPGMDDVEVLLRAADTALYRAKNAGRNRVERALASDFQDRKSG